MNAVVAHSGDQCPEALLALLREATAALEAGDSAGFEKRLDALVQRREHHFAEGVAHLARHVHQAIYEMGLDNRLACIAERDITDACTHLDHVVKMTESAAHRTLDLVEDSRKLLDEMTTRQSEMLAHPRVVGVANASGDNGKAGIAEALDKCGTALRSNLSSLAQAQEYQDLSGQLIGRVIDLVRDVEAALVDLLRAAGAELKKSGDRPIKSGDSKLLGPAAANPASQQDADSLLADLGF
jgi:chemotaxis protein CheZ